MDDLILINAERQPVVSIRDGEVFANSRNVADYFQKRHDHVLRDIDNLLSSGSPKLGSLFVEGSVYHDQARKDVRVFDMTRDGFSLLAMGFTGQKALAFKLNYIAAFNAMEAELRRRAESAPAIDLNDPAQLRGLLLSYSEKAEKLEAQVQELLPSQKALNRISVADGSYCITDAAKTLGMRPKDLFAWLSANGWIYKRPGSGYWLGYQDKCNRGDLEHKTTTVLKADGSEKITEQVRITAQGLAKIAKLMPVIA